MKTQNQTGLSVSALMPVTKVLGGVTAFERGSGIDDGDFQGISYREVSSDEVITAYKALSK